MQEKKTSCLRIMFSDHSSKISKQIHALYGTCQWNELKTIRIEDIATDPARGELALLLAASHQQCGDSEGVIILLDQARQWNVAGDQILKTLVVGLYYIVARSSLLGENRNRAEALLRKSVAVTLAGEDTVSSQAVGMRALEREVQRLTAGRRVERMWNDAELAAIAKSSLEQSDALQAIDKAEGQLALTAPERVSWYLAVSKAFGAVEDRITAEHYANKAKSVALVDDTVPIGPVIRELIRVRKSSLALDLLIEKRLQSLASTADLDEIGVAELNKAFGDLKSKKHGLVQHGHVLLLDFLKKNFGNYSNLMEDRRPVAIEIGTTREDVSGQGSTQKIAEFCHNEGIDFITVDMDPHNSEMAQRRFGERGFSFQAITAKGEDFLKEYAGLIDFVFLDAYDFDHGKHSELRQSRYKKFLGSRIDDKACHLMHLECAKSLITKLAPFGVICFDDTWLEDGDWVAKGTLAMPFLLESGFTLLDVRNRAALLGRKID